jgi:hypothetical protein
MPEHELNIVELEKLSGVRITEAFPTLEATLGKVIDLGSKVMLAQTEVYGYSDEIPNSNIACRKLFARLLTDLYAVSRLAFRGYSLQAVSLVASSFETAFMIMYIGQDNTRGTSWTMNTNPYKFADNLRVIGMIKEVLTDRGFEEPDLTLEVDKRYKSYSELCSVKHSNVYVQGQFQFRIQEMDGENVMRIEIGPDAEPRSLFLSASCLQQLFSLVVEASRDYVLAHIPEESHEMLLSEIHETNDEVLKLTTVIDGFVKRTIGTA